ncbi:RES family NAD+ phosphorylase [Mesorhizobium sp. M0633]|uniref:RES family NAD+ phosphorylase n=1 Tax=Mesorhizobium sp. M0633 TaxID=2956977 RepID=UPI0033387743
MPGVPPPPDFGRAKLEIETIPRGRTFGRIYWSTYPDPLGYGKSPSRFSDPRRRVDANRFGVLYLGDSLKVCFLETVLRDRREGILDDLPIEEVELTHAQIPTNADLRLVDLRGDNAVRMGVPTDVGRAQRQNLARRWSLAEIATDIRIQFHPGALHGIRIQFWGLCETPCYESATGDRDADFFNNIGRQPTGRSLRAGQNSCHKYTARFRASTHPMDITRRTNKRPPGDSTVTTRADINCSSHNSQAQEGQGYKLTPSFAR